MHIINNINAKTFSHNGRNYVKNFIVIKQGATNIAIHNAYDTKFQLVGSTHFSQFQVNGVVYTSQADLMANLVNILFVKNLGNGAISNTSELINDGADGINPFVTVADLPSANKILNQTGYNLSGETLTINADWVWLIANQQYTNPAEVVINVPLASSGMTRIDLIVANNNNTFQRIAGTEAENNAIAPPVPNNTIQATLIVVTDGIIETEPTPVGDLYLEKADEGVGYFGSSSGIIENFILKKYTNYIILDSSSVTQINSASFLSPVFNYVGKRIRITNQQSTPIVFKHNFGAGELKFDLINDNDFILGTDETINFIIQDDYTLLHVAEINTDNLPIPTLQQVTDAGNSTYRDIVINGLTIGKGPGNLDNVAFGRNVLTNTTTGSFNVAIGNNVLSGNTSGTQNFAVGFSSLLKNTTGSFNTAFGISALLENTTASQNIAIGNSALRLNTTGSPNLAIGNSALFNNTTGIRNVAIGNSALNANITGTRNVAIGQNALAKSTNDYNFALGTNSLSELVSGSRNIMIGAYTNTGIGLSSGSDNIFIGAGYNNGITNGSGNVTIGNVTGLSATTSNNIIIADGSGNRRININELGNVGLNVNNPQARLDVKAQGALSTDIVFRVRNSTDTANLLQVTGQGTLSLGLQSSAPTGIEGAIYYNSTTKKHYGYDGTNWVLISAALTVVSLDPPSGIPADGQQWIQYEL